MSKVTPRVRRRIRTKDTPPRKQEQPRSDGLDERGRVKKQNDVAKALVETRGQIGMACRKAGVPTRTHRDWMKRFPRYARIIEEAQEEVTEIALGLLWKNAHKGDHRAIALILSARAKHHGYGDGGQDADQSNPLEETNSPTLDEILEATPLAELQSMVEKVRQNG